MTLILLPEYIQLALAILIFLLLALGPNRLPNSIFIPLTVAGLVIASLSSVLGLDMSTEKLFSGMIQLEPSTTIVRFAIPLFGALVIALAGDSPEVQKQQRPQLCLFVAWLCFLAALLFISRNLLVSMMALSGMAAISVVLTGYPFASRFEGEAILRSWRTSVAVLVLGFTACLGFALLTNDLNYDSLRTFLETSEMDHGLIALILSIVPFLAVAGIFPFHKRKILQAHASTWAAQAADTLLIRGPVTLAFFKFIVLLFAKSPSPFSAWILEGAAILGFLGIFSGGLSAITQANLRQLGADLSQVFWSGILITLGNPEVTSIAASFLGFLTVGIGLGVCFLVLSGTSENRESDRISVWRSMGRQRPWDGVALIFALGSLVGLPPFVGFSLQSIVAFSFLEDVGQAGLLYLVLGLAIQWLVAARLLGLVYSEGGQNGEVSEAAESRRWAQLRHRGLVVLLVAPLLLMGLFWEGVWITQLDRSGNFIIF